ncbi:MULTISPECIES: hypothetical protein [unclassified Streptomyces]
MRGGPAQVVHGAELRGPGAVCAGPADEQGGAVTYGTSGPG